MITREVRTPEGFFTVTFYTRGSVSVDYVHNFPDEDQQTVSVLCVTTREEAVFYLSKLLDEVNFGPSKN